MLGERTWNTIKRHLDCIHVIFEEADRMASKYGPKPNMFFEALISTETEKTQTSFESGAPFRRYLHWLQKKSSRRLKAKWVIRDRVKFQSMVDELSTLVRELREITSSVADINHQREFFTQKIAEYTDIEELEIIEEALSEEDPALSSAASERRIALTEAAMTLVSDRDDMMTHADTDMDAHSSPTQGKDRHSMTATETWINEYGKPQEVQSQDVSTAYGHQNNLSKIQGKDFMQLRNLHENTRCQSKNLNGVARTWIMKQLHHFRNFATETPFISFGFADDSGEDAFRLVCSIAQNTRN